MHLPHLLSLASWLMKHCVLSLPGITLCTPYTFMILYLLHLYLSTEQIPAQQSSSQKSPGPATNRNFLRTAHLLLFNYKFDCNISVFLFVFYINIHKTDVLICDE